MFRCLFLVHLLVLFVALDAETPRKLSRLVSAVHAAGSGMLNGRHGSGRDSQGTATAATAATTPATAPFTNIPAAQPEPLHPQPPTAQSAQAARGIGGGGSVEGLELAVRQYHQHQHPYPESVGSLSGSGRHGRHSPVGSEGGSSMGARSVGGREEAAETGTHVLDRRRMVMSRGPVDQVSGCRLWGCGDPMRVPTGGAWERECLLQTYLLV